MIRSVYLLILTFLFATSSYGQTGSISGKVISGDTNETIPLATIQILGTTLGTAADTDGSFSLTDVPIGNQTLIIRSLGWQTNTIELKIEAFKNQILVEKECALVQP